jgi:hypothetical protein
MTAPDHEALRRDVMLARQMGFNGVRKHQKIASRGAFPNLPDNPSERHYVQALYHLTRTLDSTRPVIGNDGWGSVATDIIGIHDYDDRPDRIMKRHRADEVLPRLFKRERPGGGFWCSKVTCTRSSR